MSRVRPSISQLVNHIEYIAKLAEEDQVVISSDYNGVECVPAGIKDVITYPKIASELKQRGYSDGPIKKISGGDELRVIRASFWQVDWLTI